MTNVVLTNDVLTLGDHGETDLDGRSIVVAEAGDILACGVVDIVRKQDL